MKKLLTLAFASAILAGCGQAPGLVRANPQVAPGTAQAHSKAGTERGVREYFKSVFAELDKDMSADLRLDEMPPQLAFAGMPLDAEGPEALMRKLDLNMDGRVTLREFYRREFLNPVLEKFRRDVVQSFVSLDKNADRALTEEELAGTQYVFADLDRNANGKLTLSEFEDGVAASLGSSAQPAPPEPAEPGDEPGNEG